MQENSLTDEEYDQKLCHACLSCVRKLFPLGKYCDVYDSLLGTFSAMDHPQKMFCWECMAVLRKIKLFKDKVRQSQMLLQSYLENKLTDLPTLSTLKSVKRDLILKCTEKTESKPDVHCNISYLKNGTDHKNISINIEIDEKFKIKDDIDVKDDIKIKDESEIEKNVAIKQDIENKEENFDNDDFDDREHQSPVLLDNSVLIKPEKKVTKPKVQKSGNTKKVRKRNGCKVYDKITTKYIKEVCQIKSIGLENTKELIRKEKNSKKYKFRARCKQCSLEWPKKEYLVEHNKKFHRATHEHVCEYCTCRFESARSLSAHEATHGELLGCAWCQYRSPDAERMRSHLVCEHRVRCNNCGAGFGNVFFFFRHYKQFHELFICEHCGFKTRERDVFERHMLKGHLTKHRCDACDVEFKNRSSLATHNARKHAPSGGENAYCVECDKQFKNVFLYREHFNTWKVHKRNLDDEKHKAARTCPACGKTYARAVTMRNHYNFVHLNKSNYECALCAKLFLNRTKYVNHVRYKHEGKQREKNKICSFCGRGFSARRILENHLLTHTGERPHACPYCPARFIQKYAMKIHVDHVHLNIKRNTHA